MMKQKIHRKKKKSRSRAAESSSNGASAVNKQATDDGGKLEVENEVFRDNVIESLREAFHSVSLVEVTAAYRDAGGDPNKAAEILSDLVESGEDPCTSSISSGFSGPETGSSSDYGTGSSSSFSDGFIESGWMQKVMKERWYKGGKHNRVIAATGTVSNVIGKEYMKQNPVKKVSSVPRLKAVGGTSNRASSVAEDDEQFLCSMLGDDSDLSLAVVRDVLCQCGYDVVKAAEILLDMSSSSSDNSSNGRFHRGTLSYKEDNRLGFGHGDNLADMTSCRPSSSPNSEVDDNFLATNYYERSYASVLASSKGPSTTTQGHNEVDLPHKVLESLFKSPQSQSHRNEPDKMNWRTVAKKLRSLGGSGMDACSSSGSESQPDTTNEDAYHQLRKNANKQWGVMNSYYQKAAEAYSKGGRAHAAYLSVEGRSAAKKAQRADKQASQEIFVARNKGIENVITIDLHGQHVKEAMKLLKIHLLFGSYVPSVGTLRVITGCGSQGMGKSKIKQTVVKLLEREGIRHWEENIGTVMIKLDACRQRHFSFVDTHSDSDSD